MIGSLRLAPARKHRLEIGYRLVEIVVDHDVVELIPVRHVADGIP